MSPRLVGLAEGERGVPRAGDWRASVRRGGVCFTGVGTIEFLGATLLILRHTSTFGGDYYCFTPLAHGIGKGRMQPQLELSVGFAGND